MDVKVLSKLEFDKILEKLSHMAATTLGKKLVADLLPSPGISEVENRLRETNDALTCLIKKGSPPLGGIRDIGESLKRVEMGGILSPSELLAVADNLSAARLLKSYVNNNSATNENNAVVGMISCLEANKGLEDTINTCIISEEEISDNASAELKTIRRKIKELQQHIKDMLDKMIRSPKFQRYMQEPIVTIREDRYVIPIKSEHKNEVKGLIHDYSASGATVYVEPLELVDANNRIKQMKIREKNEIERILVELTGKVYDFLEQLETNIGLLGQIDFAFAKAKLSVHYEGSSPMLNSQGKIKIKKGRHPLLKKEEVVPIDFWIGDEFKSLVITGPNTGGKTVTLKTVGLFTLMTQAGLHIPALDGSEMCVYKNIFADIGDEQSIEQSLSTFSSHMTNIVGILEKADENSLVLLDELGAGTDPTEGAALAMAIIDELCQRGATTVSTTHYSEVKLFAVSTPGVENAACEFDVKTLRPTFRLLIGVPGKSNAFAISKRLGLSKQVLEKAADFVTFEEKRLEDVISSLENEKAAAQAEREKAEAYRREIEMLNNELERKSSQLERQKERIIREAKEEARKALADAKEKADMIVKQLIEMKQSKDSDLNREAERLRNELGRMLNKVENDLSYKPSAAFGKKPIPADEIKPGDTVFVLSLNQEGTVLSAPDRNKDVAVQVGMMKINVSADQLSIPIQKSGKPKRTTQVRFTGNKSAIVSPQIDLRGSTAEEARQLADKFIDDASLAGLKEVTVIHGKGSGTLRSSLHAFLKTNPQVDSFRLGEYGEGDTGVTVIKLS